MKINSYIDFKKLPLDIYSPGKNMNLRRSAFFLANQLSVEYSQKHSSSFSYQSCVYFLGQKLTNDLFSKSIFKEILPVCFDIVRFQYYQSKINTKIPIPTYDLLTFLALKKDPRFIDLNFKAPLKFKLSKYILKLCLNIVNIISLAPLFFLKSTMRNKIGVEVSEKLSSKNGRSETNWINYFDDCSDIILFLIHYKQDKDDKEDKEFQITFTKKKGLIFYNDLKRIYSINGKFIPIPVVTILGLTKTPCISNQIFSWILTSFFWTIFLKKMKINTWLMIDESTLNSVIIRNVIEKQNGLLVTRQRSELSSILGHKYQPGHIGLFWNEQGVQHFNKFSNEINLGFVVGHSYIDSKKIPYFKTEAQKILKEIENRNIANSDNVFIGLFDNLIGPNADLSTDFVNNLIGVFCKTIQKNKNIVLIVKSKKKDTLLGNLNPEFTTFLKNSPYVYIVYGNLLPSIIALSSDICFGFGINSAAWEANILGRKTMHIWPFPDKTHGLFNTDAENYLITTLIQLQNILDDLSKNKIENHSFKKGLINHTNYQIFDKYCDGQGPARTAIVLENLRARSGPIDMRKIKLDIEQKLIEFNKTHHKDLIFQN